MNHLAKLADEAICWAWKTDLLNQISAFKIMIIEAQTICPHCHKINDGLKNNHLLWQGSSNILVFRDAASVCKLADKKFLHFCRI